MATVRWLGCFLLTTVSVACSGEAAVPEISAFATQAAATTRLQAESAYQIVNVHSGMALDVAAGSTMGGAFLVQQTVSAANSQHWLFISSGGGAWQIVNANSGKCIDASTHNMAASRQLQQWDCHAAQDPNRVSQQFTVSAVSGGYHIVSKLTQLLLDDANNSRSAGDPIIQWAANGGANQVWEFKLASGTTSGGTTAPGGATTAGATSTASGGATSVGGSATTTGTSASGGTGTSGATSVGGGGAGSTSTTGGGANLPDLACPQDVNDPWATTRQACVRQINVFRATLALPPYGRWCGQAACIDAQAAADAQSGTAHSAFGHCTEWAQNECPNWPDPVATNIDKCLMQMWAEGPGADFSQHGHFINMSSTRYTQVECGFKETASGFWGTQDFR